METFDSFLMGHALDPLRDFPNLAGSAGASIGGEDEQSLLHVAVNTSRNIGARSNGTPSNGNIIDKLLEDSHKHISLERHDRSIASATSAVSASEVEDARVKGSRDITDSHNLITANNTPRTSCITRRNIIDIKNINDNQITNSNDRSSLNKVSRLHSHNRRLDDFPHIKLSQQQQRNRDQLPSLSLNHPQRHSQKPDVKHIRTGQEQYLQQNQQEQWSSQPLSLDVETMPAAMTTLFPPESGFGDILTEFWMDQGQPGSPLPEASISPEASHTDRLLSFRNHQPKGVTLLDELGQPITINMSTQLHGMFFLAESPWDAAGNPEDGLVGQPKELTCYRRNLFQVSGSATIPIISTVLVQSQDGESGQSDNSKVGDGKRRTIQSLEATITGIETTEGNTVKIIMVPWKSAAAGNQSVNDDPPAANTPARVAEKEPAPIFLNYSPGYMNGNANNYADDDNENSSYQLNWKRLQFRSATANNGRRKDLQQHFLVKISIIATLMPENGSSSMGEKIPIAEAYSGEIIVRGRSPRNFSSRNDIPISGSVGASSRQAPSTTSSSTTPPIPSAAKKPRHHSSGSISSFDQLSDRKPSFQQLQHDPAYTLQPHPIDILQTSLDGNLLLNPGLGYSPNLWPGEPSWIDLNNHLGPLPPQQFPAPTFLTQDFTFTANPFTDHSMSSQISVSGMDFMDPMDSPQLDQPRSTHIRPALTKAMSTSSPATNLVYEYFPIGLDDWLPPVDVVYRPHAAHHQSTVVNKGPSKSKRLFSETPFE